ncbi:MAG: alpha-L-fucosidase [Verrucomicrobia bacterium]|nr:alpha-L-fucosidase [Verrucomicrobiota bacterium]
MTPVPFRFALVTLLLVGALRGAAPVLPEPAPHLGWWREARFGMFIHWGPAALTGKEISWSRATTGPAVYDALHRQFNPVKFDARAWIAAAKAAGMRYVVLTAKHHDGFMLWATQTDPYNIMQTPFGRDVVAELATAAREAHLPFCYYFSPGDWRDPDCRHPQHNPRFVERMHAQLTELLTRYGRIPLVWIDFDGWPCPSRPEDTATLIRRLQPDVILNNRLLPLHPDESHGVVGRWGDYATPEQRVGSYCDSVPWETCMTIATQWNWKPDDRLKSLQQCLETLVSTVGGDGNLLFNVGPKPDGEIEPAQVQRLAEMGAWLRRHGEAVYGTRGGPWMPTRTYASTRTADAVYVHLFGSATPQLPPLPASVRHAALLDGTPVEVTQTTTACRLKVPPERRDPHVTVVKLQLTGSPFALAAIPPASTSGSLAYRRPAIVSSSIAPQFMHTAEAALDDNEGTFWSPGRDETIAAGIYGRRFDHFRLLPKDPLWLKSGWLEVDLGRPTTVRRALLMERLDPRNYLPVTAWTIEYEGPAGWVPAATGHAIGRRTEVALPRAIEARRFRLRIAAEGRPALAEFQLLP